MKPHGSVQVSVRLAGSMKQPGVPKTPEDTIGLLGAPYAPSHTLYGDLWGLTALRNPKLPLVLPILGSAGTYSTAWGPFEPNALDNHMEPG